MKKAILVIFLVFSSFFLFAVEATIIDTTDAIATTGSEAKTTLKLDTSTDDTQYIEIGFSSAVLAKDDFTSPITGITDNTIGLIPSSSGTASYGGADGSHPLYAYYRVHYTGQATITILTSDLSYDTTNKINTEVSGNRKDILVDNGFSTGGTGDNVTYTAATIFHQDSATRPVADSILLTVNTESYLDKPSGNYTGTITLEVTTDSNSN